MKRILPNKKQRLERKKLIEAFILNTQNTEFDLLKLSKELNIKTHRLIEDLKIYIRA